MKPARLVLLVLSLCAACGSNAEGPPDVAINGGRGGGGGSGGSGGSGGGGSGGSRDTGAIRDTTPPRDMGAPRDVGARADSGSLEGGAAGPPHPPEPGSPGEILHNYVFEVKCPMPTTGTACAIPDDQRNKTSEPLLFGGDSAVTYRVKLHFCGAVEGREYQNCQSPMAGGLFCPGGVVNNTDQFSDTYPTYEMKVSAPARSYFLNSRRARDTAIKIDYSAELEVQGGAEISFATVSRLANTYTARNGGPHTCPFVPRMEQPYPGQFIHFTVESVTPVP